ncbi:hypothetical protein H634G_00679 [Metarhizium anisopliae BRIP 53293]|uniref:DUF6594 domain-containing protein n=1 Tax=Metarhizium anisopliae BRIP 53293 TaxID=1291518 RepID=A0A0D9PHL1_METAN|nr:hypothetical protein H634G_00679 [Metarhizium anisopliae BRIP 53293]KJK94519.1 hypothetical protein H633G_01602 [Metarhizium anisopliae BRIP 53284]
MSNASETCEPLQDPEVPANSQHAQNDDQASVTPAEAIEDSCEVAKGAQGGPSPGTVDDSNNSVASNHIPSASASYSPLEIISPRPSPHAPSSTVMPATVEECFDEDDPGAQLDAADTPPSYFCVTTPPINETPLSPSALDKDIESDKPEMNTQEDQDEQPPCQVGSPDISAPQSTNHIPSQRRPSVMDYLISPDSTKNSTSTSEASGPSSHRIANGYTWSDHGQVDHQPKPNGHPFVSSSHHGDDRKSQLSWNGQQSSFRLADNPLSIHSDYGSEVPYRGGYALPYDRGGSSAPRSNASVAQSDVHPDQHTGTFYPEFANHLETMAPSGYHLLAAKLSGGAGGQPLVPIYRRFDALNHRLLLYMQDEIAELERQLIALEAQDTAKRSYLGGVIPASRRQDRWISNNLTDQKTEVLGHIGYKLSQYNQVLASFRKVQDIPVPTWRDIHLYKTYLTTSNLIVDDETRFLDAENDLVSLSGPMQSADDLNTVDDGPTPMPKATEEQQQFPPFFKDNGMSSTRAEQATPQRQGDTVLVRLALSCMCVVFVPVITFAVVPNFIARMAIVVFVALSVGVMIERSGLLPETERHKLAWILYSGLYCGAMAVVAGTVK